MPLNLSRLLRSRNPDDRVRAARAREVDHAIDLCRALLTERGEKDLEITDVKVDGPIEVTLVKDEKWPVKTNDRYFLTVKFVPGSPIGVYNTDKAIPVTDADDPFATFTEWAGAADDEAYGEL